MKVAILSAIYDNYDDVKPVLAQSNVDCEWIMVTDQKDTGAHAYAKGWKVKYEPRDHLHPNRAAKTPKCLPWLYTGAEASIWIDGSFQVLSPNFVVDLLGSTKDIAQFVHPWRNCAYDEARECIAIPKYARQPLEDQIKEYEDQGFPPRWGLFATGVIARWHTEQVMRMGFEWLTDIYLHSYQDQVSYPPALWRNNLYPTPLKGTHLTNEWLAYQGSGRHSHG